MSGDGPGDSTSSGVNDPTFEGEAGSSENFAVGPAVAREAARRTIPATTNAFTAGLPVWRGPLHQDAPSRRTRIGHAVDPERVHPEELEGLLMQVTLLDQIAVAATTIKKIRGRNCANAG